MGSVTWVNLERGTFLLFLALFSWSVFDMFFAPPLPAVPGAPMLSNVNLVGQGDSHSRVIPAIDFSTPRRDPFVPEELLKRLVVITPVTPPSLPTATPPVTTSKPVPPLITKADNSVILKPKPVRPVSSAGEVSKTPEKEAYILPVVLKGVLDDIGEGRRILVTTTKNSQYLTMVEGDEFEGAMVREITSEYVVFENELGDRFLISLDQIRGQSAATGREKTEEPQEPVMESPTDHKKKESTTVRKKPAPSSPLSPQSSSGKGISALLKNPVVQKLIKGKKVEDLSPVELKELMDLVKKNPELQTMMSKYIPR